MKYSIYSRWTNKNGSYTVRVNTHYLSTGWPGSHPSAPYHWAQYIAWLQYHIPRLLFCFKGKLVRAWHAYKKRNSFAHIDREINNNIPSNPETQLPFLIPGKTYKGYFNSDVQQQIKSKSLFHRLAWAVFRMGARIFQIFSLTS